MMKEERLVAEGALEEARSKELEQRSRADGLKQDLDLQRAQVQRHLTQVCHFCLVHYWLHSDVHLVAKHT